MNWKRESCAHGLLVIIIAGEVDMFILETLILLLEIF